jgi:hypothetical protein
MSVFATCHALAAPSHFLFCVIHFILTAGLPS